MINYKYKTTMKTKLLYIILLLTIIARGQNEGNGEFKYETNTSCLLENDRTQIQQMLIKNRENLVNNGIINRNISSKLLPHPLFSWPVTKNPTAPYNNVWSISNHVDHNPSYPNLLQDWNCGARTYDTSNGYNHKGIDIYTWPFSWHQFQNNYAWAVAAAPGIIIGKSDGNYDMSCGFNNNNWNAVYLQHSDGSVSWYGHLKNNSLTPKVVGDLVETGEYLGVIGSSGNSTGPHLHFEVYNSNNQLIDTFLGSCNNWSSSTDSWWLNQKPYQDPKINAVLTHNALPEFNTCPATENVNLSNDFASGSSVYCSIYLADQVPGTTGTLTITRPNGTLAFSTEVNFTTFYYSSYWWWNRPASMFNQNGVWTLSFSYLGNIVSHNFNYGTLDTDNFKTNKITLFPNPASKILNINTELPLDKITMTDLTGKKVLETNSKTINVESIAKGLYMVEVLYGDDKWVSKFVKE
jgi:hypothetical protein